MDVIIETVFMAIPEAIEMLIGVLINSHDYEIKLKRQVFYSNLLSDLETFSLFENMSAEKFDELIVIIKNAKREIHSYGSKEIKRRYRILVKIAESCDFYDEKQRKVLLNYTEGFSKQIEHELNGLKYPSQK